MSQEDHWYKLYTSNSPEKQGWYEPHLQTSLTWIKGLRLAADAPIIDAGGGASTLVDDLLDAGYRAITVLDLSAIALSAAKERLGGKAGQVTWLQGDVTSVNLPAGFYELWHDRAMFHFLTGLGQGKKYRETLLSALKPGGHLIIGTFAPEAPARCSGLPVQRYSPEELESAMGPEFELQRHHKELHRTPGGVEQMYLFALFRKRTERPDGSGE